MKKIFALVLLLTVFGATRGLPCEEFLINGPTTSPVQELNKEAIKNDFLKRKRWGQRGYVGYKPLSTPEISAIAEEIGFDYWWQGIVFISDIDDAIAHKNTLKGKKLREVLYLLIP